MDKKRFIEIIESKRDNDASFLSSLKILQNYVDADLKFGENDNVYNSASINELIEKGVTEDDLSYVRNANWILDEKKENLIRLFI